MKKLKNAIKNKKQEAEKLTKIIISFFKDITIRKMKLSLCYFFDKNGIYKKGYFISINIENDIILMRVIDDMFLIPAEYTQEDYDRMISRLNIISNCNLSKEEIEFNLSKLCFKNFS